jgi:membrane-associated phospholipid phosphatase
MLLSLALAAWIALRVSMRQALLFLACVGSVTVLTAFLKAWFAGCHYDFAGIHSPSGHTGFSVVAYGGVATVLAAGGPLNQRRWIALLYVLWVLGIGLSRVLLHDHTPQEVMAGYLIGGIGVAVFAFFYRAKRRPGTKTILFAAGVMACLAVFPPMQVSFEPELGWLGSWFARELPICV